MSLLNSMLVLLVMSSNVRARLDVGLAKQPSPHVLGRGLPVCCPTRPSFVRADSCVVM